MKKLILGCALIASGCSTMYSPVGQGETKYREIVIDKALLTTKPAGECWLDLYFPDGSKLWVSVDRLICNQPSRKY